MIVYDTVNSPTIFQPAIRVFRQGLQLGISLRSALVRLAENAPLSQGVEFPTPYIVFMGRFNGTSGQIVWQIFSFGIVRGCVTNLSRLQDWHLIRMNRQGLVPRRRGERNSGALSSEPFDMFGLNFQSLKRVEVGTGMIQ